MSMTKQIMMMPGRDPNSIKALPVFLVKLVKMLDDKGLNHVICWDNSGHSFHIIDSTAFCNEVLPQYFKHKNLNSFVRQLNFYGFRKLVSVDKTSLCYMKSSGEDLHFMHPKFVRGYPDLMFEIKRQTNPTKKLTAAVPKHQSMMEAIVDENDDVMTTIGHRDLVDMMSEMSLLRQKTDDLECTVDSLNRSHDILWQEMRILRETNTKQSDCFNKLIQFLISVMPANKRVARRTRPFVGGNADELIVASRHGSDILSVIQQQLSESFDISKQSVFEEEDAKNEENFEFSFNEANLMNPVQMVPEHMRESGNQQQLLPVSNKMFQPKKIEIVNCRPTTSYDHHYQQQQQQHHGVHQQQQPHQHKEHIYSSLSPMLPDESLLDEIDKNNLLGNQDLMEYFESSAKDGSGGFGNLLDDSEWENLLQLSPNQSKQ